MIINNILKNCRVGLSHSKLVREINPLEGVVATVTFQLIGKILSVDLIAVAEQEKAVFSLDRVQKIGMLSRKTHYQRVPGIENLAVGDVATEGLSRFVTKSSGCYCASLEKFCQSSLAKKGIATWRGTEVLHPAAYHVHIDGENWSTKVEDYVFDHIKKIRFQDLNDND